MFKYTAFDKNYFMFSWLHHFLVWVIPVYQLQVAKTFFSTWNTAGFNALRLCSLSGLGYGSQVVVLYTGVYYIIILAWAFLYLFSSFSSELPWATCKNSWNTGDNAYTVITWHFYSLVLHPVISIHYFYSSTETLIISFAQIFLWVRMRHACLGLGEHKVLCYRWFTGISKYCFFIYVRATATHGQVINDFLHIKKRF